MFASAIDRKPHPILLPGPLDEELVQPPLPPEDLPKPWVGPQWLRLYALAFLLTVFGIWFLSQLLVIPFLDNFANSFTVTLGLFLYIGLYLINRFQLRGYYANHAARANKPLNKAIYRYRNRRASENLYQLFPRYMIGGEAYYLVWYVPNTSLRVTRPLTPGSEPLLFNHQGEWVDDEGLFQKALMMWFYGVGMSPTSLSSQLVSDYNGMRRMTIRYLPRLPRLLDLNEKGLVEGGLADELRLVRGTYPAKCAFIRNTLALILGKIQWANAHGGDSLIQLRHEDILAYHEAMVSMVEKREAFLERHDIAEAEGAAIKMRGVVIGKGGTPARWPEGKALEVSLQIFFASLPAGDHYFTRKADQWLAPEDALKAYRSRLTYAREIDAKRASREVAAKRG